MHGEAQRHAQVHDPEEGAGHGGEGSSLEPPEEDRQDQREQANSEDDPQGGKTPGGQAARPCGGQHQRTRCRHPQGPKGTDVSGLGQEVELSGADGRNHREDPPQRPHAQVDDEHAQRDPDSRDGEPSAKITLCH